MILKEIGILEKIVFKFKTEYQNKKRWFEKYAGNYQIKGIIVTFQIL